MKVYTVLIVLLATLLVWLVGNYALTKAQGSHDDILITAENLLAKINKGEKILILDVRTEGQYKSSSNRIKGDLYLQEEEIDVKLKDVPKDMPIVAYCTWPDEATSARVAGLLKEKGFKKTYALKGGYFAWLRVDGPIEPKK